MKKLLARGLRPPFANAYPVPYLRALGLPHAALRPRARRRPCLPRRLRPSASTVAYSAAGVSLRPLKGAARGLGLTHDIEGRRARQRGIAVPERAPEEAAEVLWRIAARTT